MQMHPRLSFHGVLVLLVMAAALRSMATNAFTTNRQPVSVKQRKVVSELRMFNMFDDWKNFFKTGIMVRMMMTMTTTTYLRVSTESLRYQWNPSNQVACVCS
jgi:hypothetical protein